MADSVNMKPKFVAFKNLLPRDDSGGIDGDEWKYPGEWDEREQTGDHPALASGDEQRAPSKRDH